MKKNFFYILLIALASLGSMGASAKRVVKVNNLSYALDDETQTAHVTWNCFSNSVKTTYNLSNVVVYDTITDNGIKYTVTSIGLRAFYNSVLDSIFIPNTVISIADEAFSGSTLKHINFGDSLSKIGYRAFYKCEYLRKITLPDCIKVINEETFSFCTKLSSITMGNNVDSIGKNAFENCAISTIVLSDSIKYIGERAFAGCKNLVSIDIPYGVHCIERAQFLACQSLKHITLPNSVTTIKNSAFSRCLSLDSIILPNRISYIEDFAFENSGLINVKIPDSVTVINKRVFYECHRLENVIIPYKITSIEEYAFTSCSALSNVTCHATNPPLLANSSPIFGNCNNLSSIYVPCGTLSDYKDRWSRYASFIKYKNNPMFFLNVDVSNELAGFVDFPIDICDSIVKIEALPNEGYHFSQWSDGILDNPRIIKLTQDTSLIAEFAINTYTLSVMCEEDEGSIEGTNGVFEHGTRHDFTAIPNSNYRFDSWSDNVTDNPRTIMLERDTSITANFIRTYNVRFYDFNEELLEQQTIDVGDNAIAPELPIVENYIFVGWDKDFTNVQSDLDIYPIYEPNTDGVDDIHVKNNSIHKILHEGQMYILREGTIYTVQGKQLE